MIRTVLKATERVFDAAIYFEDFESVEPRVPIGTKELASRQGLEPSGPTRLGEIDDEWRPSVEPIRTDGVTEWSRLEFLCRQGNGGPQQPVASAVRNTASAQGPCSLRIPARWDGQAHADSEENGWYETYVTSPAVSLDGTHCRGNLPFCTLASSCVRNTTATTAKAARLKFPTAAGPAQKSFSGCRILAVPTIATMHLMRPYWLIWPILPASGW